jgi:hypothetical protein
VGPSSSARLPLIIMGITSILAAAAISLPRARRRIDR